MLQAIELAKKGMETGNGGPFGCVIVKDGKVIGQGSNMVLKTKDPTAHAEVVAIRDACKNLNNFQLDGCELYTSCSRVPCAWEQSFGQDHRRFFMPAPKKMQQMQDSMMILFTKKSM